MINYLQACLFFFMFSLLLSYLLVPVAMKTALKLGAVDYPGKRRVNTEPVPRMGGIAVFISIIASVLVLYFFRNNITSRLAFDNLDHNNVDFLEILISLVLVFGIGFIDDVKSLNAKTKFILQLCVALLVVHGGLVISSVSILGFEIELGFLSYFVTVLFLASFTNILNLIDGLDGLAGGVSVIAAFALGVISLYRLHLLVVMMCLIFIGSMLGFLKYNFHPAKIFLGDCGSLLIGYVFGILLLLDWGEVVTLGDLFSVLVMFGVPITDTLCAIIRRRKAGKSVGEPDKGHIHHRLLTHGFDDQIKAVLHIYMWSWTLSLLAMAIAMTQSWIKLLLILVVVVGCYKVAKKYELYKEVSVVTDEVN